MANIKNHPNNCCPTALKIVSSQSDDDVLSACLRFGFNEDGRRGMYEAEWTRVAMDLGLEIEQVKVARDQQELSNDWNTYTTTYRPTRYGLTLKEFTQKYREGVYLVRVPGHLMVVSHGAILDPIHWTRGARRHVLSAYRVLNSPLLPLAPKTLPKDPSIKFLRNPSAAHQYGSKTFFSYREAYDLAAKAQIKLSTICHHTTYTRKNLRKDIRLGNVEVC